MKRKMTKIACLKCMSVEKCHCLPERDPKNSKIRKYTDMYIYQSGTVETPKALKVILAKQTLDNGVVIRSGTHIWIPYTKLTDIKHGGRMIPVPNWKINEVIKMQNNDKLKG